VTIQRKYLYRYDGDGPIEARTFDCHWKRIEIIIDMQYFVAAKMCLPVFEIYKTGI
jgi:hypothetical protein